MWGTLRRWLFGGLIVCCLGLPGIAGDYPYADHSEQWFANKFMELHSNSDNRFVVVRKELLISPPDDKWEAKISVAHLFTKSRNPKKDPPYLVILKALTPLPKEAVPILTRYMATKNYIPFTELVWISWDDTDKTVKWILVAPPSVFVSERILGLPPLPTEEV